VTDPDYRAALSAAIAEYEKLGDERRRLDDRLSQLAQTISALSRLLGLTPTQPFGLTDACRVVYRNAGIPLSPTEVRERLRTIGMDLSTYSNEMSAIHTVLKRLHEAGELRAIAAPQKHLYVWQRPVRAVAIGPDIAEFIRGQGHGHADADAGERRARGKTQRRRSRRAKGADGGGT
jgi:hypothetical protein